MKFSKVNRYFVVPEQNAFYITKSAEQGFAKFPVAINSHIPNVPFFHHIYKAGGGTSVRNNTETKLSIEYKRFVRRKLRLIPIIKPLVFLVMPDDSTDVDERCLIDFFVMSGTRRVNLANQCQLLTLDHSYFISVTISDRNITVSKIKDDKQVTSKYLNRNLEDVETIKETIDSLTDIRDVPVYIYGQELEKFSPLGRYISMKQLIENFETIVERPFILA